MGRLVPLRRDIRQPIIRQSLKTSENINFRKSLPRLLGSMSANQERSQRVSEVHVFGPQEILKPEGLSFHKQTQDQQTNLIPLHNWVWGCWCRPNPEPRWAMTADYTTVFTRCPLRTYHDQVHQAGAHLDHSVSQTLLTLTYCMEYIYPVCVCLCVSWWDTCGTVYLWGQRTACRSPFSPSTVWLQRN